jgi:hypothetical protein
MNITVDYTNLNNRRNKYSNTQLVILVVSCQLLILELTLFYLYYIPRVNKQLVIKFCLNNVSIDLALSTTGYNSDFVFFPFVDEGLKTYNIYIDGIHYIKDKVTKRPIAGIMRLYNSNFDIKNWEQYTIFVG